MQPALESATGGEIVVRCLRALGVEYIFGVPGGQTLAIIKALEKGSSPLFVTAHHESAAATMADAYGRLTHRPGVCLGTTGPGATNMLTGVGGAFRDSSPVIVMTCNNFTRDLERDDTQAADHTRIFAPLTKRTWLVVDPSVIPQVLEEAYRVCLSGCPGPVLVDFSRTALETKIEPPATPETYTFTNSIQQRVQADTSVVDKAVSALVDAERPVLWVGNGVQISMASKEALALAERANMPALTTFNSISALPSSHPLVFGPRSRMGTALSAHVLSQADLLLAVGNSLNAVSTARWTTKLPPKIIQVDIEPATIGRNYADRTIGVVGDAKTVMCQMADAISATNPTEHSPRQAWIDELRIRKTRFWDEIRSWPSTHPSPRGLLHPIDVVLTIRAESSDETILIVDAGNAGVWTHLWEVRLPESYFKPVGFGNMGFGVPAAVATKLVRSTSPVVAIVGDGSLGMTLAEIETLVREHLDVCIVLLNDGGYGNIRQEQIYFFGEAGIGVDFGPIDYAAIARACGLRGVSVTSTDQLRAELREFRQSPGPTLLDVHLDGVPNVWTFPLLAS